MDCDRGGKHEEVDSETQCATKNVVIHSKSCQHRLKMVHNGRLM